MRVDGTWRWANQHSLNFSWYNVDRTGYKSINDDIQFGDQNFPAGIALASDLNIDLYRLLYRYGLARTEDVDLDVGAGLYYGKIKMSLTADATVGSVSRGTRKATDLGAPMPTAGLLLNAKLTDRLRGIFSADFFYFSFNDWEGSQTDVQIGLEYRLAKNWTLGAAYDRFVLNLEGPAGGGTFDVDNAWNSLFSYVAFHW
jgi:opacity protein-like surface antigen